jgi:antitoxin ParD1/3/4
MSITLTVDQHEWINARIANGEFESVEQAVRQLVDERIAELSLEDDDLSWAKPLVDEALAQVERGEVLTLEEHRARNAARVAALKG